MSKTDEKADEKADEIDFSKLHGLLAERILREQGGEPMKRALLDLVEQGATVEDVVGHIEQLLPTWTGTARQLGVVYAALKEGAADDL